MAISCRERRVAVRWEGRNSTGEMNLRFEGILNTLLRRYQQTVSEQMRTYYEQFLREAPCTACGGTRLRPESRSVYLLSGPGPGGAQHPLPEVCRATIAEAEALLRTLPLGGRSWDSTRCASASTFAACSSDSFAMTSRSAYGFHPFCR